MAADLVTTLKTGLTGKICDGTISHINTVKPVLSGHPLLSGQ